jgi:hypothetical protein
MKSFTVRLGEISVEESDTDKILLEKARQHLPHALKRLGEKAGEEAWRTLEDGLRNSPLKLDRSSSDKAKFVQDTAREFAEKVTSSEKDDLVQNIFEQLREQRDGDAKKV